jgi:hypothetical protein
MLREFMKSIHFYNQQPMQPYPSFQVTSGIAEAAQAASAATYQVIQLFLFTHNPHAYYILAKLDSRFA